MVAYSFDQKQETIATLGVNQEAYNRLAREFQAVKRFLEWEDSLFANPDLTGNHKIQMRALRRQYETAQTVDPQGRKRINLTTIAEKTGTSLDTASRTLKVLERAGVINDHILKPEELEDGQLTKRHYIKLDEEMIRRPKEIKLPEGMSKPGGNRYQCQKCGREEGLKIRKRITIICPCGHESLVEETETLQDAISDETSRSNLLFDNDAAIIEAEQVKQVEATCFSVDPPEVEQVTDVLPNNAQDVKGVEATCFSNDTVEPTAPTGKNFADHSATCGILYNHIAPPHVAQSAVTIVPSPDRSTIYRAAELLLAIAGPADVHIGMSHGMGQKYYPINERITHEELMDHLRGRDTYGAYCWYPDGLTRALIWDTDNAEGWALMEEAARILVSYGFFPLLEKSPAERGGHLIIIFDALVDVLAARSYALSLAPALATIQEYWPGPDMSWNRVRLPGGKYCYQKLNKWCQIVDAARGVSSSNGESAAALLLECQTPANIVPPMPTPPDPPTIPPAADDQEPEEAPEEISAANNDNGNQDGHDQSVPATWGSATLWFNWQGISGYLVRWHNERHPIDSLIDFNNGYALASWRNEKTASVAVNDEGTIWRDFGNNGNNPKHGDALELRALLETRSKRDILAETAREVQNEARQALESAARDGRPLPAWVAEIVTPSGRSHYEEIARGGYLPIQTERDEPQEPIIVETAPASVSTGLPDDLVGVGQEYGLVHSEPCVKCGCEVQRNMVGSDLVCVRCYPGRGYHRYSEIIDRLYVRGVKW